MYGFHSGHISEDMFTRCLPTEAPKLIVRLIKNWSQRKLDSTSRTMYKHVWIISSNSSSLITLSLFTRVRKALNETHILQQNGCIFSSLRPNGRGHTQIKVGGIKYLGHRIAAADKIELDLASYNNKETKLEASHRCGVPRCINPTHLIFELSERNQTRDCCRMFRNQQGYRCPHLPLCINQDTGHVIIGIL